LSYDSAGGYRCTEARELGPHGTGKDGPTCKRRGIRCRGRDCGSSKVNTGSADLSGAETSVFILLQERSGVPRICHGRLRSNLGRLCQIHPQRAALAPICPGAGDYHRTLQLKLQPWSEPQHPRHHQAASGRPPRPSATPALPAGYRSSQAAQFFSTCGQTYRLRIR
jgi:hypothetical protein